MLTSHSIRYDSSVSFSEHLLNTVKFDRLLEELLPVLHIHFLRQGVKSSMFCSQWFLTLFSYR